MRTIKIHRGINQIGGCITEISTDTSRIFIDLGDNLPGTPDELTDGEKQEYVNRLFSSGKKANEAVFFTHSHGDHVGMINYIPGGIPMHMGEGCHAILKMKNDLLMIAHERNEDLLNEFRESGKILDRVITWPRPTPKTRPKSIVVGDIKVVPYQTSHSSFDSYMLMVYAGGKKILHTGDFRDHGYLGGAIYKVLDHYVGQVDVLITEGTMLAANRGKAASMRTVEEQMRSAMDKPENKYVFILASSTDIEKLAAVKEAAHKTRKPLFVNSGMMNRSLAYFNWSNSFSNNLFKFEYSFYNEPFEEKMQKWIDDRGFVLLTGSSEEKIPMIEKLIARCGLENCILIYSFWEGYYKRPDQIEKMPMYKRIRDLFGPEHCVDIHTSGHANRKTIEAVINKTNPREAVIGIHKEASTSLLSLNIPNDIKAKVVPESINPYWIEIVE